ncbi:protein Lines 1 [Crotalus adamanteus]|uniref:Protein Lines 1 n=1 Tax=Crotalus adamanteus TaxID=8729 RepID=A0AAW1AWL9_CROAD
MHAKLQLQEVAAEIKQKYVEILRILEESNIVSELNSLNSAWIAFCVETLSGFPSNSSIAGCLWTLTSLIKEMLNDDNTHKRVHLENLMGLLLTVLKSHLKTSASICLFEHPCTWISLFVEQDDEIVEAAKSLLAIYLNFERFRHDVNLDDGSQDNWTHQNGYNAHSQLAVYHLCAVTEERNLVTFICK